MCTSVLNLTKNMASNSIKQISSSEPGQWEYAGNFQFHRKRQRTTIDDTKGTFTKNEEVGMVLLKCFAISAERY